MFWLWVDNAEAPGDREKIILSLRTSEYAQPGQISAVQTKTKRRSKEGSSNTRGVFKKELQLEVIKRRLTAKRSKAQ